MKLAVSVLGLDNDSIKEIDDLADIVHLDIMDGIFVDNISSIDNIGFNSTLDVHLMVSDVYKYIDHYAKYNPEFITFHVELESDIKSIIEYIKSLNIKVGLAINPSTDLSRITPYLDLIDLVLVMSVEAGYGGQKFIESTYDRIDKIRSINDVLLIEVDGGINDDIIEKLDADLVVIGSFITKHNFEEQINLINKKIRDK